MARSHAFVRYRRPDGAEARSRRLNTRPAELLDVETAIVYGLDPITIEPIDPVDHEKAADQQNCALRNILLPSCIEGSGKNADVFSGNAFVKRFAEFKKGG